MSTAAQKKKIKVSSCQFYQTIEFNKLFSDKILCEIKGIFGMGNQHEALIFCFPITILQQLQLPDMQNPFVGNKCRKIC